MVIRGAQLPQLQPHDLTWRWFPHPVDRSQVDLGEGKVSFLSMLQGQGLLKDLRLTHNGGILGVRVTFCQGESDGISPLKMELGEGGDPWKSIAGSIVPLIGKTR